MSASPVADSVVPASSPESASPASSSTSASVASASGSSALGRRRVNEIDLLRFLAALAVVFFHYAFRGYAADGRSDMPYPLLAPVAKYGYLGVELFFLISGFVILMTASRGSLRDFSISRFVRLYPAFWACCTLTYLAIGWLGNGRYSAGAVQYLVNMTMLSGFVGVPSIDGVYWSLFVELQFYAMVAAVLAIGRIQHAQWWLVLWLVATLALEVFPVARLRSLLLADYAAFFIAGAAAFLIWSRGASALRWALMAVSLGIALHRSLASIPSFEAYYRTDLDAGVVAALVTSFFVVMALVATGRMGVVARMRWAGVGALTYPLYLLHQYIGYMIFNAAYPAINAHVLFWGTLALMLALSHAVHVLVERRFAGPLKRACERAWDGATARAERALGYLRRRRVPAVVAGDRPTD